MACPYRSHGDPKYSVPKVIKPRNVCHYEPNARNPTASIPGSVLVPCLYTWFCTGSTTPIPGSVLVPLPLYLVLYWFPVSIPGSILVLPASIPGSVLVLLPLNLVLYWFGASIPSGHKAFAFILKSSDCSRRPSSKHTFTTLSFNRLTDGNNCPIANSLTLTKPRRVNCEWRPGPLAGMMKGCRALEPCSRLSRPITAPASIWFELRGQNTPFFNIRDMRCLAYNPTVRICLNYVKNRPGEEP